MIFYYSGTGNTRYAAVTIGKAIGDKRLLFIPALVREIETGKRSASSVFAGMADDEAIGFMFPVYSWGVPPIVTRFVREVLSPIYGLSVRAETRLVSLCGCFPDKSENYAVRLLVCLILSLCRIIMYCFLVLMLTHRSWRKKNWMLCRLKPLS